MIVKSYIAEQNISNLENNIVLFYGENLGLKIDFKNILQKSFKGTEFFHFNQDEILKNVNNFFLQINNISLFEKKKVFFIENTNDKILDIIKETVNNSSTKIYLFADNLDKKSKIRSYFEKSTNLSVVACYNDNEIGIRKIILEKLKGFEGLSPENINMIIDNCNLDRIKLKNELHKIISYFTNKKIDNNKLKEILNLKINDDFNILKDEAINGNKIKTNKLLSNTIIDTEKNILYLNIINQRLNKLAEVTKLAEISDIENVVGNIKPPIFWKDKPVFLSQAKKWNSKKIRDILGKTYNLELEMKSNSVVNKNILIKKLLVDICELANFS